MKSYFILNCEKQDKISESLYNFLMSNNLLEDVKGFWNSLTRQDVIKVISSNPELMEWFDSLGLKVRDMSFTVCNDEIYTGIHKDEPPVIAKINFPVLNTKDTYNIWYDDWGNEIDRVECTKPIVLRSDINHTVEIGSKATYPRIQFSFCFYSEPLHLLK